MGGVTAPVAGGARDAAATAGGACARGTGSGTGSRPSGTERIARSISPTPGALSQPVTPGRSLGTGEGPVTSGITVSATVGASDGLGAGVCPVDQGTAGVVVREVGSSQPV